MSASFTRALPLTLRLLRRGFFPALGPFLALWLLSLSVALLSPASRTLAEALSGIPLWVVLMAYAHLLDYRESHASITQGFIWFFRNLPARFWSLFFVALALVAGLSLVVTPPMAYPFIMGVAGFVISSTEIPGVAYVLWGLMFQTEEESWKSGTRTPLALVLNKACWPLTWRILALSLGGQIANIWLGGVLWTFPLVGSLLHGLLMLFSVFLLYSLLKGFFRNAE